MRLEHLLSGAGRHGGRPEGTTRKAAASDVGDSRARERLVCFRNSIDLYPLSPSGGTQEGGLAQLARAPALQAGGQRFESVILHTKKEHIDMMEAKPVRLRKEEDRDNE